MQKNRDNSSRFTSMKKSLKILILIIVLLLAGGGTYYWIKRPNIVTHREIDAISIDRFKTTKAKELAVKVKDEYKLLFDVVYAEGPMDMERLQKRMREKGAKVLLIGNLFKKYGITNEDDIHELTELMGNCMSIHHDNLEYFDPERFGYKP